MTRRSIIVGVKGREGQAWAKARAQLDYDAARPPGGGTADTSNLTASSLPSLDYALTSGEETFFESLVS